MAFDAKALLARRFPDITQSYGERDTMLYALGVGCGADPLDAADLRYVTERDLVALPTMAVVLASPVMWVKESDTGIDWKKVLHGEQGMTLHAPVPTSGTVIGTTRILDIIDKGTAKGAFVYMAREVREQASGKPIATLTQTLVLRGNGGYGGPDRPTPAAHAIPSRAPDTTVEFETLPQAALIYRLSGDTNPLHSDPEVAKAAGFPRPILHGLCTLGVAGRALLKACCGNDTTRFKGLSLRFSAPVYPGERILTEIWRDGGIVSFRSRIAARNVTVLDNGRAEIQL